MNKKSGSNIFLPELISVAILNTSCGVFGNDPRVEKGVRCTDTLTYQGKPLYASSAPLPGDIQIGKTFDSVTSAGMDSAFTEAMRLTKAKVMSAAVISNSGKWAATRAADGSSKNGRLYWASVGKMMTATVILQG